MHNPNSLELSWNGPPWLKGSSNQARAEKQVQARAVCGCQVGCSGNCGTYMVVEPVLVNQPKHKVYNYMCEAFSKPICNHETW